MPDNKTAVKVGKKLKAPTGFYDVLPNEHEYHTFIKKVVRHRARQAGFRRISTPSIEDAHLFKRAVGENTDIVENEMYNFQDKEGQELTLKPEGTAGIVRAYIQHGMKEWAQPVELYYIEPHFRHDPEKKERYRLFWQFGFEILGESDPALDVQCMFIAHKIFKDLGIADEFKLEINNIGSAKSREKYQEALVNFYVGKERSLCDSCQNRLHKNSLRLLDCREEDCAILAGLAPKFEQFRSKEDAIFHDQVKEFLGELGMEYTENDKLVRGLDYYSQTVFEFLEKDGDLRNVVGGGGRYDDLVEVMGGESTPALGFSVSMDQVIAKMKAKKIQVPSKDQLHIFVAQLGGIAKRKSLTLVDELRDRGIRCVGALGKGSVKAQMGLANRFNVPYTLIMGITEVREGKIIIRDMAKGQQRHVMMDEVVDEVVKLIGEKNLDRYSPGEIIQ